MGSVVGRPTARIGEATAPGSTVLVLFIALAVVVGAQLLRVMITMDAWWLRGQVGTLGVIPYAFAPFVLGFAAVPLARPRLVRPAIGVAVGLLVISRVAEQISHQSAPDMWISTAGVVAFLLLLPLLATVNLRVFGVGLLLGLALDAGIKGAFRTLDLSWMQGPLPVVGAVVLAGATAGFAVVVLRRPLLPSSPTGRKAWSLVSLGPVLFVVWQVVGSPGWIATQTGWAPEISLALVLAGLAGATLVAGRPAAPAETIAAAVVLVGVTAVARWASPWFGLPALAGLVAVGVLVGAIIGSDTSAGGARTAAAIATGNLLLVILLFAFYTTLDLEVLPFRQPAVLFAAGALIAGFAVLAVAGPAAAIDTRAFAVTAAALLVVPAALWMTRIDQSPGPPDSLSVMSYNIAQGIAVGGQLDPEGVARVVEESGVTVVGFQEISRSYLLAAGTDLVWWLSHRLDLPFTYGWAEDGGNATFTRYPIDSSRLHDLPLLGTLQRRTALESVIRTGSGEVLFLNTHLTHRVTPGIADEEKESDYATVQIPQIEGVAEAWGGRRPAVLVGDFNMRPEWGQYLFLLDRGLVDGWVVGSGPGYTTADNGIGYRIDYVFHTPDLEAAFAEVIDTGASVDHLPVVVHFAR